MVLCPVVAARIEVVQSGGAEGPVPAEAKHIGSLQKVVVIGVETGQRGRAVGARRQLLTVMSVITGNALLSVEYVIALDAGLVHRCHLRAGQNAIVVDHVSVGARSG